MNFPSLLPVMIDQIRLCVHLEVCTVVLSPGMNGIDLLEVPHVLEYIIKSVNCRHPEGAMNTTTDDTKG